MKTMCKKGKYVGWVAILGITSLLLTPIGANSGSDVPENFDNQGQKLFQARQETPEQNLTAESGDRTLASFYALRQYPGSPPRIPHEVDLSFSGNETDCLSCHGKGGYSAEFGKYAPVTPHPENTLCYQCHATTLTEDKFVETEWKSIDPPRLGQSALSSSPPPIPHSLLLRENCIACHTGPAAVVEIRVSHASRGDCRQCHAAVVQSAEPLEFERK